jgi:hypothetical protein
MRVCEKPVEALDHEVLFSRERADRRFARSIGVGAIGEGLAGPDATVEYVLLEKVKRQ